MKKYSPAKPKPPKIYSVTLNEDAVNDALEIHNNLSEFLRDALDAWIIKCKEDIKQAGIK
jgi:hypothetical protein